MKRMVDMGEELAPEYRDRLLERISRIPIMETMGLEILEMRGGTCVMKAPRRKGYDGIFQSFHGGLLMTVADSAAAFALMTLTGPGAGMTTTDMNIRFLAPCLTDLTVKARVIKHGRTLCPMAVDLYDDNGQHLAVAQVSYFLLGQA